MDSKFHILAFIGATFIFTKSKLLKPFREYVSVLGYGEFIQCCQCIGFWMGLILSIFVSNSVLYVFCMAFICSFLSYVLDIILNKINRF